MKFGGFSEIKRSFRLHCIRLLVLCCCKGVGLGLVRIFDWPSVHVFHFFVLLEGFWVKKSARLRRICYIFFVVAGRSFEMELEIIESSNELKE